MVYSDFTQTDLEKKFHLQFRFAPLFKDILGITPSKLLLENLELGQFIGFFTEKARLDSPLYGCSTIGTEWNFLKLEGNTLSVDIKRYHISSLASLLGVLQKIIDDTKPDVNS